MTQEDIFTRDDLFLFVSHKGVILVGRRHWMGIFETGEIRYATMKPLSLSSSLSLPLSPSLSLSLSRLWELNESNYISASECFQEEMSCPAENSTNYLGSIF